MKNDLIVERATIEWMRMTDDGSMGRSGRTGVEQGFQPASRPIDKE